MKKIITAKSFCAFLLAAGIAVGNIADASAADGDSSGSGYYGYSEDNYFDAGEYGETGGDYSSGIDIGGSGESDDGGVPDYQDGWDTGTGQGESIPDGTEVMKITASAKGGKAETIVRKSGGDSWGSDFEPDDAELRVLLKNKDEAVKVSVEVLRPDLIEEGSLEYERSVKTEDTGSFQLTGLSQLRFRYYENGEASSASVEYAVIPAYLGYSVDNLNLVVNSSGFHPGDGAYMPIQVNFSGESMGTGGKLSLRVRILNSKGKYVFQKTFKAGRTGYVRYRWNGKASKKNEAGIKEGAYVPDGTYTVEAALIYKRDSGEKYLKSVKPVTAKKSFKVSSKAPSGTQNLAGAREIPVYTGNDTVDYLAELMLSEAGVKSSMSMDEKVKAIYHYMTLNFHHVHSSADGKAYYDTKKLAKKIKKYGKASLAGYDKKKIIYSRRDPFYIEDSMITRSGVCTNHAEIFAVLCKHAGIDAGVCSGLYLNRNGTRAGHSWNYAVINGVTWYYDIDVEIQNLGKGQGDYYWYKKTRTQANQTHEFSSIETSYNEYVPLDVEEFSFGGDGGDDDGTTVIPDDEFWDMFFGS